MTETKRRRPAVTVVVPAYRAEATIGRALTHLISQPIDRVIVVVDGLLDETATVCEGIGDKRIEVIILEQNQGAQRARNHGLARVTTEAVLFHDADDYVEGELVAGLTDVLTDADVAFAPMTVERNGRREPVFMPDYRSPKDLFWRWFVHRQFVNPAGVMWRTDYLRSIGGWDEKIEKNQDGELAMRAVLKGARIATSGRGQAVYVRSDTGVSRRANKERALLLASEKILAVSTTVIEDDVKRDAVARHTYRTASDCFDRGENALGRLALRRARELGFTGHYGPPHHRLIAYAIGIERKARLFRLAKRWLRR